MSFLFETIALPFWFIVFFIGSAMPLWIKWYKIFYRKYIVTGILQKKFQHATTSAEDMKKDVLKKATEHWDENGEASDFLGGSIKSGSVKKRKVVKKSVDSSKKKNIRAVLKVLAEGGETGVLPKSISDKTDINTIETNKALTYLLEKEYAEEINSTNGIKFYLTKLGKQYCVNKKYIS